MFSKAKSNNKDQDSKPSGSASESSAAQGGFQSLSNKKGGPRTSGVPSIISSDVVMRGNITSSGEIQFDGTLEGDLKAGSLIVGDQATVRGEIVCEAITVRGRVEGGIRAKSVSLTSTAHIQGDILHSSLSVETGAHFEGNCRHSDDPLSDSSAKDFRRGRPAAQPPRPVASASDEDSDSDRRSAKESASFLSGRSPLR